MQKIVYPGRSEAFWFGTLVSPGVSIQVEVGFLVSSPFQVRAGVLRKTNALAFFAGCHLPFHQLALKKAANGNYATWAGLL